MNFLITWAAVIATLGATRVAVPKTPVVTEVNAPTTPNSG